MGFRKLLVNPARAISNRMALEPQASPPAQTASAPCACWLVPGPRRFCNLRLRNYATCAGRTTARRLPLEAAGAHAWSGWMAGAGPIVAGDFTLALGMGPV